MGSSAAKFGRLGWAPASLVRRRPAGCGGGARRRGSSFVPGSLLDPGTRTAYL